MKYYHITSRSNPKIKALLKQKESFFFFEGEKLVRDIVARAIPIHILLVDERKEHLIVFPDDKTVKEKWLVSGDVLAKFSNLADVPPVIAVVEWRVQSIDFSRARVVVGFDQIQDPGNAGTVFRCAAAFGIDGVVFSRASVHFNNSKFIRAAQDTLFEVPHQHFATLEKLIETAQQVHMNIYLTSSHTNPKAVLPQQIQTPCLILFGNEGQGLPVELFERYPSVFIPQTGKVESLNVGISACLLMYHVSTGELQQH